MTEERYTKADTLEGIVFLLIWVLMAVLIPASCIVGLAFLIGVL